MFPSDFIKNILNIQDKIFLFQKKTIFKLLKKKYFLNLITMLVHIVTLKILLKMVQEFVKLNIFLTRITILNLSLLYKVDCILDKRPELEINFNIYQDIIQAIKHNNFKRFEGIVEKYLGSKEKISEKMRVALKTLKKYMEYIKNMFETNITNRVIEGLNNKIKSIKRITFGYSKFSNFKKRILIQEGIVLINA